MSAKMTLEGSSTGAVKAVQDYQKALDSAEKQTDKTAAASKRLQQEAQRIKEAADPQERYNRKLREAKQALDAGLISTEQFTRRQQQLGDQLRKTGDATDNAFGAGMLTKLGAAAAGYISVSQAVGVVTRAFSDMEQRAQQSADALVNALGSAGELQQLGPEAFAKNAAVARQLVRSGAVAPGNLGQAFDIATNLANAGFSDTETQFLINQVAGQRIVRAENLESLGGALRKFQSAFDGQAGTLPQVLDKVLVAAGATQANATQTVSEVLKFAGLAANAGVGAEQALAAFVGVEQRSPTSEAAAERLASFFSQVNARQLAKGDLFGTLGNVESLVAAQGGNAFKVLGDKNAVQGYLDLMRSRDVVRNQLTAISGSSGALAQRQGLLSTDPALRSAALRSAAEGNLAIVQGSLTDERENLFDALAAERRARRMQRHGGMFASVGGFFEGISDWLGREHQAFGTALETERQIPGSISPGLKSSLEDYMRRAAEAAERTESNTSQIQSQQRAKVTLRPE